MREEDAAEIVRLATDDQPLSPNDVDEIARRSGGNALFLFELLDMVRETGTTEALPDSVESVIAGDIDRLSPSDRTVLRYASVLGASFDTALLATAVHDDVELDAGVWDRLHGLVDGDPLGEMRFKNTLVRDAAYEGLPFRRRRVLHERVGEAIEALSGSSVEEEVSALALHFFEARRDDKAWQYCRLAGDRARAVVANVEAARFYRRALEAARRRRDVPPRERAEVWKALGAVQDSAGRFAEAYDALRQATKLLRDDPAAQAETYENRTRARIRSGEYGRALARDHDRPSGRRRPGRSCRGGERVPASRRNAPSCGCCRAILGRRSRSLSKRPKRASGSASSRRWRAPTRRSTAPTRCSVSPRRRRTSARQSTSGSS